MENYDHMQRIDWYAGMADLDPGSGDHVVVFLFGKPIVQQRTFTLMMMTMVMVIRIPITRSCLGSFSIIWKLRKWSEGDNECIEALMETVFQVSDRYVKIARKSLIR